MIAVAAAGAQRGMQCRSRAAQRLDQHVTGDTAAERDLHAVDLYEERAAKCAASGQANGVTGMDAEVIQSPLQAVSCSDVEDACLVPRRELIECHESK